MTDLQLALLGLGILIIAAIVLFNWWQERRLRTSITERLDEPRQDALMDEFHFDSEAVLKNDPVPTVTEPVIGPADKVLHQEEDSPAEATQEIATADELAEEASLDKVAAPDADFNLAAFDSTSTGNTKLPESVNQKIDLIALVCLPKPVTGAALREFLLLLTDLDKPIYAHGLDSDNVWHLLTHEQESAKFTHAAFSLQLADRSGVVSQPSLTRFQNAVDSIANKLGVQVEWQGNGDPWLFANELDEFCVEVDKMIGFHLVQGDSGPFTGTKFRGLAEASGLVLNEDGGFYYESELEPRPESAAGGVQKLFSVVNQDSNPFSIEMLRTSVIHRISFQLDIPRVRNCAEVFNQMVLIARQMESSLGAHLVDDKGRPLGEPQIEKIREQLKVIHARMIARGVAPGSDSALRLFS